MIHLRVPDMSCGHCAATIEKAITSLDPAARVTFDMDARTISVETDQSLEAIGAALKEAGYGTDPFR